MSPRTPEEVAAEREPKVNEAMMGAAEWFCFLFGIPWSEEPIYSLRKPSGRFPGTTTVPTTLNEDEIEAAGHRVIKRAARVAVPGTEVEVALHEAIKRYGEARIAAPGTEVAAVRAIETAAAEIPPVDPAKEDAAAWTKLAQSQLPASAAVALAYRLLKDPRIGAYIVAQILSAKTLKDLVVRLDTSGVWRKLASDAHRVLFYDERAQGNPRGRIVRDVVRPRLQISSSSSVGLEPWQLKKLRQAADGGSTTAKREAALVSIITGVAAELFANPKTRWGRGSPADLLDRALRGELENAGIAVTEKVKRWLQRATKEERNTIYTPAQDEEDESGEDDFLTDKLIEIGDPYQLVALHDIMALDDREAIEKAIRPQGPSGQRYIVEAMRVMGQWELARDPTVKEMAERLATPRSHQYVEKLRARWRDRTAVDKLRPAAKPTPRPPTHAPSLPVGYREDLHARFLAAVARKDKQLLAAQVRRRRNHQPHEWVPDDQRGAPYYSCECGAAGRKDLTTGQIRKVP